jgi:hypothetical protein
MVLVLLEMRFSSVDLAEMLVRRSRADRLGLAAQINILLASRFASITVIELAVRRRGNVLTTQVYADEVGRYIVLLVWDLIDNG